MLTCQFCIYGNQFTPRPDEISRFGDGVMGCNRPHYEGYTGKNANCEAFYPKLVSPDFRR